MLDAIALGELLIDFATVDTDRDGYPTLAAHPGGAPGNFLAALHAYGCSGAMLGKVGADTFGDLLCATLAQAGIRTEGIVRDPSVFTTLAFVTFGPGGERAFSFARKPGADTQLRFDELDLSLLDEARLLHFGSLSLTQEPVRSATQQAAAYAAAHGKLLSFDPNLRLPLWPDADAAKTQHQDGRGIEGEGLLLRLIQTGAVVGKVGGKLQLRQPLILQNLLGLLFQLTGLVQGDAEGDVGGVFIVIAGHELGGALR